MTIRPTSESAHLVRRVTAVRRVPDGVAATLQAYAGVELGGLPGWLTGEPAADQGVEVTMPNLPDLELPPLDPVEFELAVRFVAPETVRLTVAPVGHRVLDNDGSWLGIVVDGNPHDVAVSVDEDGDDLVVSSGLAEVRIGRSAFHVHVVAAGQGLVLRTAERLRQVAGLPVAPPLLARDGSLGLHLELGTDEQIYGFGEQFGRLVKNGHTLVLRSEDALGTGTGLAYKPVPVWQSSQGYTGFLNTGAIVTADVGNRRPSVLGLTVADEVLDLYVVTGADPKRRLTAYTDLTGRAPVPPLWAFGYWMGRCRYHSAADMHEVADLLHEHDVPIDVLHLDPDWLVVDRLNTDFIWNEARFGPRREFVARLAEQGVRLSVWELPYVDPASPLYDELRDRGFFVRRADGGLASIQRTPTPDGRPRSLLDFTNPQARQWWQEQHRAFLDDGVAVFKTDFGEALPDDAVFYDGTPRAHSHNLYPLRYNGAVSDGIARITGRSPLVWGRSGWAGSQRYPGQWGGDAESTVAGMQATVRGGLSYAVSAPGFWSHDIGGFFGPELTPELYVRWTQMGALSPLMRAHGLRPREPYTFGEEALAIARRWIRLRYRLLPYLWQVAHESAANGWPMMRPVGLEYPDDPVASHVDDCFLLGSDLLVVPVYDDGGKPVRRRFYLPEGEWLDAFTGAKTSGGRYAVLEVDLASMPVFVRSGTLLPTVDLQPGDTRTDDLLGRPWSLRPYGDIPDGTTNLVGFDGTVTQAEIREGTLVVTGTQPMTWHAEPLS